MYHLVTTGGLLNQAVPQFPHMDTRDNKMLSEAAANELLNIKGLAQVAVNVCDDDNGDSDNNDLSHFSLSPAPRGRQNRPLRADAKTGPG